MPTCVRLSRDQVESNARKDSSEAGFAMLVAILALSIFSLLGMYVSMEATTEVRIAENYESRLQSVFAARAGLSHARELIRGLDHNALLQGPDGSYNSGDTAYMTAAQTSYGFRNWVSWTAARSLDILDPAGAVSGVPDDGLLNTGKLGGVNGTVLIPATGIPVTASNPYGAGTIITARYFVKAADNPEDCDTNPFTDCDGIIILRSTGVAQTLRETGGGVIRANSVTVYEGRYQRDSVFDLDAPVVLQGDPIVPAKPNMFSGNSFNIDGGSQPFGIGTIDTNLGNSYDPRQEVANNLDAKQYDNITGSCCGPGSAAVGDITPSPGDDNYYLLDPDYMYNFMNNVLPRYADRYYQGSQKWSGGGAPDLGHYDPAKPRNDPSQRFKITFVDGDLSMSGNLEGGGILAVTGKLSGSGSIKWNGLILVIGGGNANLAGMNVGLNGGLYAVKVTQVGNSAQFGATQFTMSGNSNIKVNDAILQLAIDTLPAREISVREVTSSMDP